MPNKFHGNPMNAPPKSAIPMPPRPGTKGVKIPAPTFTPHTNEPKKGL